MTARVPRDPRVVLVTGSTSGIGQALAESLAAAGLTVGLVGRDAARCEIVRAEIAAVTGNANVRAFAADLSRQGDVRALAAEVLDAFPRVDVVAHCAAVFLPRRTVTPEGLETMFATNHLAPFLLTALLRDRLVESAPARVLTLTAPSTVRLDFDDLQAERRFRALTQFGATKTANLLFAFELARRMEGSGVVSNAVHPGLARTGLMRGAPGRCAGRPGWCQRHRSGPRPRSRRWRSRLPPRAAPVASSRPGTTSSHRRTPGTGRSPADSGRSAPR